MQNTPRNTNEKNPAQERQQQNQDVRRNKNERPEADKSQEKRDRY